MAYQAITLYTESTANPLYVAVVLAAASRRVMLTHSPPLNDEPGVNQNTPADVVIARSCSELRNSRSTQMLRQTMIGERTSSELDSLESKTTVFSVPIRFLVINGLLMHVRDDKRLDSNTIPKYGVYGY